MPFDLRCLTPEDKEWVRSTLRAAWASEHVVTRGKVVDASLLPGWLAIDGSKPIGLVTFRLAGSEIEVISLNSLREHCGVGTALIEAVTELARAQGYSRVWLITTNDNMAALRFYQKRGFRLAALHRDALTESRRLKPQIPLVGLDGIPLRDEIELERLFR